MKKVLLLMCGFVMFSCSEELSQGEQRVETSEVSTEGTSLLVANVFFESVKKASNTRALFGATYPDYYGGCYMSDEGRTVFKVVKGCLNSARVDLEKRVGTSCFDVEECEYSYNFMDNILKELDSKFFSKDFDNKRHSLGWLGYGINNRDNVIEIELRDCTDGSIARFKAEVMDSPIFRFEVGYEFTNKWDDSNSDLKESRNATRSTGLAMGGEIWCLGSRGSIGYRAKNSSNEVGFVTAGHVGPLFTNVSLTFDGAEIGYAEQSVVGGVDAAFITLYSGYEITSTLTAYGMNSIMTTLPIVLVENNGVGKEGSSTFYSTGKVLATGRRITNDGVAINNVTVTDYDSDGGDSGGVVFDTSFRRLAGIHQGARKDGTEHYYVVEADIRSSLGVTPY